MSINTENALSRAAPTGCSRWGGPDLAVVCLHLVELAAVQFPYLPRQRVRRGSLEHVQLVDVAGDHGDQLHACRSGADHADPLAGEVNTLLRPSAGEQRCAGERIHARDVGFQRRRQDSRGCDDEGCDVPVPRVGLHHPLGGALVERHRHDVRVEPDVAAQVESVGDEVQVGLDLGLGGHGLRPHPLLLDLVGEAVRVLDALDIAARAGVAVEQPCAADILGLLQHLDPHTEFAQTVQHVEPREPGPDDEHIGTVHLLVSLLKPSRMLL